ERWQDEPVRQRPVLITDAERSQEDQLRIRTVRYVVLMMLRLVSLLVAALLIAVRPPLLGLWLTLCAIGMIIVPWVAVVLANDRRPKERHRWRRYRAAPAARRGLPEGTGSVPPDRVIEADESPER